MIISFMKYTESHYYRGVMAMYFICVASNCLTKYKQTASPILIVCAFRWFIYEISHINNWILTMNRTAYTHISQDIR